MIILLTSTDSGLFRFENEPLLERVFHGKILNNLTDVIEGSVHLYCL